MSEIPLVTLVAVLISFPPLPTYPVCVCPEARTANGWCDACDVGYLAGLPVRSEAVFDILHTHGHQADPETMLCESCLAELARDGFCTRHGVGFVDNELYFSRLAWYLARGEPVDAPKLECAVCRRHAGRYRHDPQDGSPPGWCERCRMGYFGTLGFDDRAEFAAAMKEFEVLLRALETLDRCESCATAMLCNGRCPIHEIGFRNGLPD